MSLMDSYCFHKVLPDVSIVSHILFQGFPMVKTPKKGPDCEEHGQSCADDGAPGPGESFK